MRWKRWIVGAAALVLLYAVVGFLVLPAVIKAQLPPRLGRMLGREVRLERVRVNPFVLSVTLDDFLVNDRDGKPFLGWQRLYVNAQLSSLVTRTTTFKSIELTKPYGRVVIGRDGKLNFSDIIERLNHAEPTTPTKTPEKPRELAIGYLAIAGASLQLSDLHLPQPFDSTIGPFTVELTGFRTERNSDSPYEFKGRTESGESFAWTGFFSLNPLKSAGHIALHDLVLPKYRPFLADRVAFDLRKGTADVEGSYTFAWTPNEHVCHLQDASIVLHDLALAQPGNERPAVSVSVIEARGIGADLLEPSVEITSLALRGGSVEATRLAGGEIDLLTLLTPKVKDTEVDGTKNPGSPMSLLLHELAVSGFQVSFEDRATARPVHVVLGDLDLRVEDFDLDHSHSARLALATHVNGPGSLQAHGTVAVFRPAFDLAVKADNLGVGSFDPYLEPSFDVRVSRGTLSLDGRLRGSLEHRGGDFLEYTGDARLDDFEAMDGAQLEPFLRYKSLRLAGLELRTAPKILKIRSVDLVEPEDRLVVAPDGTSNVARALKLAPPAAGAGTRPEITTTGALAPPTPEGPGETPFEVSIAKVRIRGGRLTFVDRSLEPNAALLITGIDGTYTGLSTKPETQSAVKVTGAAGGLAPLLIEGRAMPLRHDKDTDVTLAIHGAELSDLTPYAGKYLGYTIRKGKLDVDAHLTIKERKLTVEDKIRMDQFFLGDKTHSPDATKLPVKLALALLRDRKGVIELDVPITGSLDDPSFHYGKVVWHAVVNVLTKLVTSPFAVLGKLFGGGTQDLSFAAFEPGSAVPGADAESKAKVLAKALFERPDLSLEVEGTADREADVAAIKKAGLDRLLRQTKAASQPGIDAASVTVTAEERETWLAAAFHAAFPTPPPEKGKEAVAVPEPPPAEMEQRLLGTIAVSADDLRQLATARTKAMIALVLQDATIEPSRVFEVTGGERASKDDGARAYFTVR